MNIFIVHFERSIMEPLCGADDLNSGTNNKHFVTCPDCKKLLQQPPLYNMGVTSDVHLSGVARG